MTGVAAASQRESATKHESPAWPKAPVLGWSSFWPPGGASMPSIRDLAHTSYTTSGRAALWAALQQLRLPSGSAVLVPTYHCPTMVAPILHAGLQPRFFPIDCDGLPQLDGISRAAAADARAMFVPHYFGLPKGLGLVREWCSARGITLVEDCAHSYFGVAGDRPVGAWGDYAVASLSKFFPVATGGMLASARHPIVGLGLQTAGLRTQLKDVVDVLEFARMHGRLAGPSQIVSPLFWLKNRARAAIAPSEVGNQDNDALRSATMMDRCDMARVDQAPSVAAMLLHRSLPTARIVGRRRENFGALQRRFAATSSARGVGGELPEQAAPYVFPLWVDGASRAGAVYAVARAERLPVFRWDRIWPGTPDDASDAGPAWSRQVLQVLCHQDLSATDIERVADRLLEALATH